MRFDGLRCWWDENGYHSGRAVVPHTSADFMKREATPIAYPRTSGLLVRLRLFITLYRFD